MSDQPQGPGWWQASDGRFSPPQAATGPGPAPVGYAEPYVGDIVAGAPQHYGTGPRGAPSSATTALVLSIISFFFCPGILAIVALVLAAKASGEIKASYGYREGSGMVTAARVLSILNLVLIPVMVALAIPTFLGVRDRASDRAAQADLRNGLTAAKVVYTDTSAWPGPDQLAPVEPSLHFAPSDGVVERGVVDVQTNDRAIALATKSRSGVCFYLVAVASDDSMGFAQSRGCGAPSAQRYLTGWRP